MSKKNKDSIKPSETESKEEYSEGESVYPINTSMRLDSELFKDEDYVRTKCVNVKRVKLPKDGENWEVLEDGKVVLTLNGIKFSNKDRAWFKTIDGIKFIMDGYKKGWRTVSKFKQELKST